MQSLCGRTSRPRASGPTAMRGTERRIAMRVGALSGDPKLQRPELKRPEPPKKAEEAAAAPAAAAAAPAMAEPASGVVTIEYQRQRAKEMRKYFEDAKLEQLTAKGKVFGWTKKNEISNGRWVMFGFFVGMLTEYATGVDFIHQIEQTISYLGIWDFE